MNQEWEYYNHALIPTTAPHVTPDISWMKDGKKWRELAGGKYPLFARWTTDFDCQEETEWWYVIRSAPFHLEELGKNARKHIRQAFKKCTVKRICAEECIDELFQVYEEAYTRYQNADNQITREEFQAGCLEGNANVEYWGGYDLSGRMIGYLMVIVRESCVEISTAKFSPQYMNLRVSDALYAAILEHYLNDRGKAYVSSGQRSINHMTNTQEYKMETFAFRKAYCHIHIRYFFLMGILIYVLYPVKGFLKYFDKNIRVHQLSGVLAMEEIARKNRKGKEQV